MSRPLLLDLDGDEGPFAGDPAGVHGVYRSAVDFADFRNVRVSDNPDKGDGADDTGHSGASDKLGEVATGVMPEWVGVVAQPVGRLFDRR